MNEIIVNGMTLEQVNAELAALDAEFTALVSGQQQPGNGSVLGTVVTALMPRLQQLWPTKEALDQRHAALQAIESGYTTAHRADLDMQALDDMLQRLKALTREVQLARDVTQQKSNPNPELIQRAQRLGIPRPLIDQLIAGIRAT